MGICLLHLMLSQWIKIVSLFQLKEYGTLLFQDPDLSEMNMLELMVVTFLETEVSSIETILERIRIGFIGGVILMTTITMHSWEKKNNLISNFFLLQRSKPVPRDLKIYKGKIDTQNRKLLLEDTFWNPELAYYDNYIYALSSFWTAIFPIDGASMHREIKKVRERWKDYDTSYGLLIDRDYYYQMLYHSDGDYYTLNRIKK